MYLRRFFNFTPGSLAGPFLWLLACLVALLLAASVVGAQSLGGATVTRAPTAASPAYSPNAALGFDDARHLLNRTSFAAQIGDIERFAQLTRAQAVDQLLAETRRQAAYPVPAWASRYERPYRPDMSPEERNKVNRREQVERGLELRTWWIAEMLSTPTPFTEKMTLFWHNHFATGQQKVRVAQLMYRQNTLLRSYALGNFGAMLREISKDPAMLVYLDGAQNRKGAPNENFAREVMELFTLGEGRYSEQDIKEVARAFTGWSVDPDAGEFRFRRGIHDEGEKSIFGVRGRMNGDDVVTLLLRQPATAEFVVSKLWREFVSPTPDAATVRQLAQVWRDSNYEIKPLMRAMLLSDAFWAPAHRASLVKSPVDLVIGSLRQFGFSVEDPAPFAIVLRQLGQDLFNPPNVKGWPGGDAWLNTTTLLARKGFLNRLFRADEMLKADGSVAPRPAVALIDRDMMGERRERAQTRLALRGAPEGRGLGGDVGDGGSMGAPLPPFGISNQLRGQYYFNAEQWFAQQPASTAMRRPSSNNTQPDLILRALLAGPPVQAPLDTPHTLAGLRAIALDPMYQLK
ncbi:MAG: DUF1800 domain-containing protein [Burkholderiales bacterium]|nr:DUF1800 domain-containing protein [Burkholderiales bacterium]